MALCNGLFSKGLFSPSRERGRRLLRPCSQARLDKLRDICRENSGLMSAFIYKSCA